MSVFSFREGPFDFGYYGKQGIIKDAGWRFGLILKKFFPLVFPETSSLPLSLSSLLFFTRPSCHTNNKHAQYTQQQQQQHTGASPKELLAVFKATDKNKDGNIDVDELASLVESAYDALAKSGPNYDTIPFSNEVMGWPSMFLNWPHYDARQRRQVAAPFARALMDVIDGDGSGKVSFPEFEAFQWDQLIPKVLSHVAKKEREAEEKRCADFASRPILNSYGEHAAGDYEYFISKQLISPPGDKQLYWNTDFENGKPIETLDDPRLSTAAQVWPVTLKFGKYNEILLSAKHDGKAAKFHGDKMSRGEAYQCQSKPESGEWHFDWEGPAVRFLDDGAMVVYFCAKNEKNIINSKVMLVVAGRLYPKA